MLAVLAVLNFSGLATGKVFARLRCQLPSSDCGDTERIVHVKLTATQL